MGISFNGLIDFHCSYRHFNALKHAICMATGGSFHYHLPEAKDDDENKYIEGKWYWGRINGQTCSHARNKGLGLFLNSSDCEGKIAGEFLLLDLKKDLKALAPIVRIQDDCTRCLYICGEIVNVSEKFHSSLMVLIEIIENALNEGEKILAWS